MAKTGPIYIQTHLEDAELKAIVRRMRLKGKEPSVTIGLHEGEIATIGAIHEFGAPAARIPSRSFLRAAFDEREALYVKLAGEYFVELQEGRVRLRAILIAMGRRMTTDVKNKIKAGPHAPLAPATIEAKGSSRPLIDTGALIRAVRFVVDADGSETPAEEPTGV